MANDQITLIEICLNLLYSIPFKLYTLQMSFYLVIIKSDDFYGIIVEWCWKISLRRGWKSQISDSIAYSANEILVLSHKMPLDNNSLNTSWQEIGSVGNKHKRAHFLRVPMKSLY